MKTYTLFFAFFIAGLLFITPLSALGQFEFINSSTGEAMKINVWPKFPGPHQKVVMSIEDFSRDINSLQISWTLNGKVVTQGIGAKTFDFTTGALGSISRITINAGGISRTVTIAPGAIDLLWQANSYVPPFYKGKALHSNRGQITVSAEPFFVGSNGARIDPAKLIYTWKKNGEVAQSSSGYGKRSFTFVSSVLAKPTDVEVEVYSTDGIYKANAVISIEETRPEIIIYENNPRLGLMNQKALNGGSFEIKGGDETTFAAVPMFFSVTSRNSPGLLYSWSQNNSSLGQKASSVVFRAPSGTEGSSSIGTGVKHASNFMQSANTSFSVSVKEGSNETLVNF